MLIGPEDIKEFFTQTFFWGGGGPEKKGPVLIVPKIVAKLMVQLIDRSYLWDIGHP